MVAMGAMEGTVQEGSIQKKRKRFLETKTALTGKKKLWTTKSCEKDDFHQVGMLPSCTVLSMAPMATLALYLHNTLKFSDKKYSILYRSMEYLFVLRCFRLLR